MSHVPQRRPPRVRGAHVRPGAIQTGTVAWLLHRASGVFLTLYLLAHLIVIGQAVRSEDAFNAALHFLQRPPFIALDGALAGIVAYHAANGLRIIAFDLGLGVRRQQALFWLAFASALAVCLASLAFAHELL